MGLEEMLSALEEEAKSESKEIISRAKTQAERIIAEAKEEAKKAKEEEIGRATSTLANERSKILNAVKLGVKKDIVRTKEELILNVIDEARGKLKDLKKNKAYADVIASLTREAVKDSTGEIVVRTTDDDREAVKKVLDELKVQYKLEAGMKVIGGVEVSFENGSITITNTLDSRLEKAAHFIKPEIASALFGG